MSIVSTNKRITAAQLAEELGGSGLVIRTNDVDGTVEIEADVAEADLSAAVEAHVAVPESPVPSVPERITALEAEVRGIRQRAEAAANAAQDPDARNVGRAVAGG